MKMLAIPALALALTAAAPAPKVTVADAWCRPAPAGALAGGCYLTVTATADDRLVAIETKAAERVEIHTMSMDGGVMRMRKLADGLALPAGQAVPLKPGGDHIMVIGPKIALKEGAKLPLTLRFRKAAPVTVDVPVKAPTMPGMHH